MSVTIRPAQRKDAHALYEMILALARYEKEEVRVKVTPFDLSLQLGSDTPPFECLIAESNGKQCGFALYYFAYSTWEGKQTLYLEDLFVYPQYRREGVGFALMSALAEVAREKDCRRFEWSVLDWNEPAIKFYEKIGARPVSGWTRFRLEGGELEELVKGESAVISGT